MTDKKQDRIVEILNEAKKISNVIRRENYLDCIIETENDSGEKSEYKVTFGENEISAKNNMTGEFLKDYRYNKNIFLTAISNYNNLLDILNPIDNRYHLNILNIIFDKANHKSKDLSTDEYIDDFIEFVNRKNFINNENYFLFLKIACEGGNFQLFEYLRYNYSEYFNNLTKEQELILSGSTCFGGNQRIIHLLDELDFDFDYNALKGAIAGRKFNIFEYLINSACTVDINAKGNFRETILHYAILSNYYNYPLTNYPEAQESLIFNYNSVNDYTEHKPTIIEYLLSWPGIDINAQANGEYTALHFAIKKGDRQLIDCLISRPNININLRNRDGDSLLHYFITIKDIDMVKKLIDDPNTDINIQDKDGRTPLQRFIIDGNIDMVEKLINDPDTDINAQANGGYTALHFAIKKGDRQLIDYLISRPNININLRDKDGDSLLHYFITIKDIDMVKKLINDPNTDINIQDKDGRTPLQRFVIDGNIEMVEKLMYNPNIDVNIKNNSGATALHSAVWKGNEDIIKLILFDPEIDINVQDQYGETPLDDAILRENYTIAEMLLSMDEIDVNRKDHMSNTVLHDVVRRNNLKIIKLILEKENVDVNVINRNKETPLIIAASLCKDDFTIPELLIEKGAKINDDKNDRNQPLKAAIFSKNKKMVKFLAKNGADFNIPIRKYGCPYKHSIFMEAINENREDVIRFILNNYIDKIDINKPYYHGHTALTEAIKVGNTELAELLIKKYGAKITDIDIDVVENKEKKYNNVNKYAFFEDRTLSVDILEEEFKKERTKRKKSEFAKILKQYKFEQDLKQTIKLITPKEQINKSRK